jgi:predicted dehydrogenase
MEKLRIGMVGMGFIADWHYQGFLTNPVADITGMCHNFYGDDQKRSKQNEKLKKKCEEWGIKPYDAFEHMIEDEQIDALIIGSITPFHFEQIKKVLQNNKHVLAEKPVVSDLYHLDELEELSKETGSKLFPAHNFVYRGAVQKAKQIIDSGQLGQIVHSAFIITHTISENHINGWRARKELAKGGTLIDSGHHLIYQLLYLLGKPDKFHGFTSTILLNEMDCEDTAQVSLSFPDGSLAVIMQSWASDHAEMINGIRIFGTRGSIVISDALYFNNEKINDDVDYPNSFKNQAKAFTDYILNDISPLSGLEDVKNTLKITYGSYKSDKSCKVITL